MFGENSCVIGLQTNQISKSMNENSNYVKIVS